MNVIFLKRKNILKAVMFVIFLFVVGTLICIIKNKKERIVYIEKKEI